MSIKDTIGRLFRRYVLEHLPKPIRRIISRNNELITQKDITNQSPENQFYYALTRHIDLNNITKKDKKDISEGKEEFIIEDSDFHKLISSLNNKIMQTNFSDPGKTLNTIYEQLTEIVLYLYQDKYSIIANSLNDKKTYSSMDEYVYEVIGQIIDSIDKKTPNVTPKYIEEYMDFIYTYFLNFNSLEDVKDALVLMATINEIDENSNTEDGNSINSGNNLKTIIDFYNKTLLPDFSGTQITLKDLNEITQILKGLDNARLNKLIECVDHIEYTKKEAKTLLSQIKDLAHLKLDDFNIIAGKISAVKPDTDLLNEMLSKFKDKDSNEKKRIIKLPSFTENNKKRYAIRGILGATAVLSFIYLWIQKPKVEEIINNDTTPRTESTSTNLEITEDEDKVIYNFYYPVLYRTINKQGEIVDQHAYVAMKNNQTELEDESTIFVLEENTDERGVIYFTKPKTNIQKENIIFPFTSATAIKNLKLDNGQEINSGSKIYVMQYSTNPEMSKEKYCIVYTIDGKSNIGEITPNQLSKCFTISPEIITNVNVEGKDTILYGFNKSAFKTKKEIVLEDGVKISKGSLVTGFSYKGNNSDRVLIIYCDTETQRVYVAFEDSSSFDNDIKTREKGTDIQYIGKFTSSKIITGGNGQIMIDKDTNLGMYLSDNQVAFQLEDGTYVISDRESPYIEEELESIWEENPNLKKYADTLGIDDNTTFIYEGDEK